MVMVVCSVGYLESQGDIDFVSGFYEERITMFAEIESQEEINYTTSIDLEEKYNNSNIKDLYDLEGNSLVRLLKTDEKDKVQVRIGTINESEFFPNIELYRWDEVYFRLKPNVAILVNRNFVFEDDKIWFNSSAFSFEMFEHDDGFKYIWYLNAKPLKNKIEFQIESEGLDFYYQPPLYEEDYEGVYGNLSCNETHCINGSGVVYVHRPIDVVGSYAVYHNSKGGWNDIDGKDYKTGFAFSIHRPKIYDSKGNWVYGKLNISDGVYSVTIPQNFLDKAVYPIKSNDDFGYQGSASTGGLITDDTVYSFSTLTYSPTEDGDLESMTAKLNDFNSGSFKLALFDSSDDSLQVTSSEGEVPASIQWTEVSASGSVFSATAYWLAINSEANLYYFYYDKAGDANPVWHSDDHAYDFPTGSFPDPASWSDSGSSNQNKWGIYATYTPSGEEDTCSCPTSGDWNIDCSDNCVISSDCDMQGNDVNCVGTGSISVSGVVSNFGNVFIHGGCNIFCRNTPACFG